MELSDYNIQPDAVLHLILRLRGGGDISNLGGIGVGGQISQKINKDPLRHTAYDSKKRSMLHVTIINASSFTAVTGLSTPASPVSANTYLSNRLPWFKLYDEHIPTSNASQPPSILSTKVKSVGALLQSSKKRIAPSCVYCPDEMATLDLIPCGHRLCDDCGLSVTSCPSCQRKIERFERFAAPMGSNEHNSNDGVNASSLEERVIKLRLNAGTNRVTTFRLEKDVISHLTGDGKD